MVGNDAVGRWDFLGLKKIKVNSCEGYLYIGHGSKTEPIDWEFNGERCIGGFVGCFPSVNNPSDPYEDTRADNHEHLGHPESNQWPNVPEHPHPTTAGTLSQDLAEGRSQAWGAGEGYLPGDPRAEHDFEVAVSNALNSIMDVRNRLCKCCNQVTIIVEVGDDSTFSTAIERAVAASGTRLGGRAINDDNETYKEVFQCDPQVLPLHTDN